MALSDLNPTLTPLKTPFRTSYGVVLRCFLSFMDCYGVDRGLTMVAYGVDHGVDGLLNVVPASILTLN
jgi:hypothetical protein